MDEDGLITEVPAHLRGRSAPPPSHAPSSPAPSSPAPSSLAPSAVAPAPIPEERTRLRPGRPGEPGGHLGSALRQPTGATVMAVWCPRGHFSPAEAPCCRTCGAPLAAQEPIRIPRPTLGVLQLADGQRVELDRGAVLGRRPTPMPDTEPWPHLVELPADLTHLSRNHVAVTLEGWHVLVRDLGSSAGTTLHAHDRAPIRLRPHDPHVLEPGQMIMLADEFAVTFAVTG